MGGAVTNLFVRGRSAGGCLVGRALADFPKDQSTAIRSPGPCALLARAGSSSSFVAALALPSRVLRGRPLRLAHATPAAQCLRPYSQSNPLRFRLLPALAALLTPAPKRQTRRTTPAGNHHPSPNPLCRVSIADLLTPASCCEPNPPYQTGNPTADAGPRIFCFLFLTTPLRHRTIIVPASVRASCYSSTTFFYSCYMWACCFAPL